MLSVLLYRRSEGPALSRSELLVQMRGHGAQLRQVTEHYVCGHWQDDATGAQVTIDCGQPPLSTHAAATTHHDDPHAEPKDYPGWLPLAISIHLPLTGPHWLCVEVGRWLESLLANLPNCGALISEDVGREGEDGYGPGPLDRPRLLACWEHCHGAQTESLRLPRMERRSSLQLWRYRREAGQGATAEPQLNWPQALVLGRDITALSTAIWPGPEQHWVLPPVDLVVIQRDGEGGLLPSDELRTAAGGGQPLPHGGGLHIAPSPALVKLYQSARLIPSSDYRALDHLEWAD
ncbi:MAG: hypothetical protein EA402_02975 [Planctomycetota bacterium]|nr:MAG: hypothetical protein EA402_02975 [Planctomycetota bacterium]